MKSVVCLSGGLDSATALAVVKASGDEVVLAVGFRYGSRHNEFENRAAAAVASHYKVPFHLFDISTAFSPLTPTGGCALMSGGPEVPEGHYEEDTMRLTVVPGRNLILIAHTAAAAERVGAGKVVVGTHAGDHFIYPDCRPEFLAAANHAVAYGTDGKVHVEAPFTKWTKTDIVRGGFDLGVPFHLTRTCYTSNITACGKCGSCQERLEAFARCGLVDPLDYNHRVLFPKKPTEDTVDRRHPPRGFGGVI